MLGVTLPAPPDLPTVLHSEDSGNAKTRDSQSAAAAQDHGVASAGASSPSADLPSHKTRASLDRGTLFTMVCFVKMSCFSPGRGESCELVTVLISVCRPWDGQHSGVTGPPGLENLRNLFVFTEKKDKT